MSVPDTWSGTRRQDSSTRDVSTEHRGADREGTRLIALRLVLRDLHAICHQRDCARPDRVMRCISTPGTGHDLADAQSSQRR
eukprot:2527462-Rhodomonas_salina.2